MSTPSKELEELTNLLQNQNNMIETLEKELNDLTLNSKSQADDPNAQQVKKLQTENDKLKYRIRILNQSIAEVNNSSSSSSSAVAAASTTSPNESNLFTFYYFLFLKG